MAKTALEVTFERLNESQKMKFQEALGMESIRRMYEVLQEAGSTSDFPLLLANVLNKVLQRSYQVVPDQWRLIANIGTLPDFKPKDILRVSEADDLQEVKGEPGEYMDSTLVSGNETYQLSIFGRTFSITWKTIINDDLDAIRKHPDRMGRAAARLLNNLVFGILESNPAMDDSNTLFHAAHNNLGNAPLSTTGVTAAISAMTAQTDDKGVKIYVKPRFLVVKHASPNYWEAKRILKSAQEARTADNQINPLADENLEPVGVDWLTNDNAWYLVADPGSIDTIEVGFLRGIGETPQLFLKSPGWTTISGMAVDPYGMDDEPIQYKVRHICQAKAIDWRGMYKSTGTGS